METNVNAVIPVDELTAVSIDYARASNDFVVDQVVVPYQVTRDTFKYEKWGREDLQNLDRQERAIGAPANEAGPISVSYIEASVTRYSLKDSVADEILKNSANPVKARNKRIQKIARQIKFGRESRLKALLDGLSGTETAAASAIWDDASTSTIESDVDGVKEAMNAIIGTTPTHMIIPYRTANAIRRNGTIRELIKYNPNDLLKSGMLPAPLFGMNVIIPGGLTDSARPGGTSSIGRIWDGTSVYFIYMDPNGGDGTMTAFMDFWSSENGVPFGTMEWRDPDPTTHKTWFASELCDKIVNTTPEAAYLLTATHS